MYYLRTKPAAQAIQFTVDKTRLTESNKSNVPSENSDKKQETEVKIDDNKENMNMAAMQCSLRNKEDCMMCGS